MKGFIVDRYGKKSGRFGAMPEPEVRYKDELVHVQVSFVSTLFASSPRRVAGGLFFSVRGA